MENGRSKMEKALSPAGKGINYGTLPALLNPQGNGTDFSILHFPFK